MRERQFDALDVISVLSFALGYENLMENRQQSAQNDVSAANDKQRPSTLWRSLAKGLRSRTKCCGKF